MTQASDSAASPSDAGRLAADDATSRRLAGRLRDDRDFRRYWWSRMLSLGGSVISYVALPVLVYRLTGSAALTAMVSALEAAPYLTFGLFAGALADRWNRKSVMVSADLVNAAVMLSVPVAHWSGVLTVAHVLLVAFVVPAIAVFFDGANFGARSPCSLAATASPRQTPLSGGLPHRRRRCCQR